MQLLMNINDSKVFLVLFSLQPSADLWLIRKSVINWLIKNTCAPMRYRFKNQGNYGIAVLKFPSNAVESKSWL